MNEDIACRGRHGKPLEVVVADLEAQRVKFRVPGQTIVAKRARALKQITHVGYYLVNAVTESCSNWTIGTAPVIPDTA